MQVRLIVSSQGSQEFVSHDFSIEEKIVLGRHAGSPVLLQGEGLSRHHFSLLPVDDALNIEDLSSNGTWLNGMLLKGQPSTRLSRGDIVEVPGYEIRVLVLDPAALPTPQPEASASFARAELEPDRSSAIVKPTAAKTVDPAEVALLSFAALNFGLISFLLSR